MTSQVSLFLTLNILHTFPVFPLLTLHLSKCCLEIFKHCFANPKHAGMWYLNCNTKGKFIIELTVILKSEQIQLKKSSKSKAINQEIKSKF